MKYIHTLKIITRNIFRLLWKFLHRLPFIIENFFRSLRKYLHITKVVTRNILRLLWRNPKFTTILCLFIGVLVAISRYTDSESVPEVEEEVSGNEYCLNKSLTNALSDDANVVKMERYIRRWMAQNCIRGVSIAIMKDQKLVYCKGLGYANKEEDLAVEAGHIFRIASASKLITAVGIMKLVDDGKLSLKDKVFGPEGILPQFTNLGDKRIKDITVRQLLDHTSGFSRQRGDPMFRTADIMKWEHMDKTPTADQLIEFQLKMKLRDKPGRNPQYSNIGYLVLSRIIEQVSGQDYESYLKEHVLRPAGCYDMHLAHNYYEERYPNEVKYYGSSPKDVIVSYDGSGEKKLREYGGNNIRGLMGAGAWVASSAELMRLVASVDGKPGVLDILSKKSVREMKRIRSKKDFALGWARYHAREGALVRTGTMSGTCASIELKERGLSFVFIGNTSHYTGPRFTNSIKLMMHTAMKNVKEWNTSRDLFVRPATDSTQIAAISTSDAS